MGVALEGDREAVAVDAEGVAVGGVREVVFGVGVDAICERCVWERKGGDGNGLW